ncbi:MAG: PQQ-dependent sugar dehydrogenase [Bacteroidota bacterium]
MSNLTKIIGLNILMAIAFFTCQSEKNTMEQAVKSATIHPTKEVVLDGLRRPWSMAFLSENEALVTEKDGDLLRVNLLTKEKTVISGFPDDLLDSLVVFADNYPMGTYPNGTKGFKGRYNGGILDVVLDPNFRDNQWIYISYAAEKDKKYASKFIRAKLQNDQLTDIQPLLTALPYADGLFHFGGALLFGDDGKLYLTTGERLFGDGLQPKDMPIAQNYSDPRGKIFRLNPDGSIPEDNPDFGPDAVPGLYAVGSRNSQGLAKHPETGNIWFTEHGTIQGDELNQLESGANFGWPLLSTGKYRGGYEPPKLDRELTVPMWSWYKTIAPTGLTFYTGSEFPSWRNNLIVPGLSRGNLWRFVMESGEIKSVEELFVNERDRVRKAVQSPEGALYILTDEANGRIIRIKNG